MHDMGKEISGSGSLISPESAPRSGQDDNPGLKPVPSVS